MTYQKFNSKILFFFLVLCLFPLCAWTAYDPIAIYLTWQRSPESTMTIRWLTPLDNRDNVIEFQKEGETAWQQATGTSTRLPENAPYRLHSVELTNLNPATNYYFRTGNDGLPYKFQTMPTILDQPIRFVVGGDMYHDTIEKLIETNRQAAKTEPLFALVGGDIAYAAGSHAPFLPGWAKIWIDKMAGQKFDRWLTWLKAWKKEMVTPDGRLVPILPVLGNHDVTGGFGKTPKEAPFFYSLFAMPGPQGYNVLDFGNYMSLFMLDSGHTHPVKGKQTQWLNNGMKNRMDVPYKFALYHVPAYPSVRKLDHEHSASIRKHWVPIFDEGHLTAAFEHHDHDYKRTYPLKNNRIDPDGVIYLGDGAWGVDEPRQVKYASQKWYLEKTMSIRHFIAVEIQPEHCNFKAISSKGAMIDQCSSKQALLMQ